MHNLIIPVDKFSHIELKKERGRGGERERERERERGRKGEEGRERENEDDEFNFHCFQVHLFSNNFEQPYGYYEGGEN